MANNFDMEWDSIKEPGGSGDKVDFLKLQNGSNPVRIVGKPSKVEIHWEKGMDGQPKKIICLGVNCPICKAGRKPQMRYQVQVLDKSPTSDGKIKVLEGGPTIFNAIKEFATDPDYGDPTKYDVRIKKEGSSRETRYTVVASPKKIPLTSEELEVITKAKPLSEVNKVKTYDEIMQMGLEVFSSSLGDLAEDGDIDNNTSDDDDWNMV